MPATILVVEPDERTRSLVAAGLAPRGFRVTGVAAAEEARRFLTPDRPVPALVISEVDLRDLDGFSLCSLLRADQRTADVPVVLLSRSPRPEHSELAGRVGADEYLPKPLFLNDVVALACLMAGRSSRGGQFGTDTATVPLAHALRALLSGIRSGRIEFLRGGARLVFREGQVVEAAFEGAAGDRALRRLLLLARGEYAVSLRPVLSRATMFVGLQELCARTLPMLRRWDQLLARCVPLEAKLVVDFSRLPSVLDGLPNEVSALIRLCDGRRTVGDVLRQSTLDEGMALEALTRLYAMAVLTPREGERAAHPEPPFFEPGPFEPALANPNPETLYEAAGVLDAALRLQLDAFRIRPVVEARARNVTPMLLTPLAPPEAATAAPPEHATAVGSLVRTSRAYQRWAVFALALAALAALVAAAFWPTRKADPNKAAAWVAEVAAPAPEPAPWIAPAASRPADKAATDVQPLTTTQALDHAPAGAVAEPAPRESPAPLVDAIALYETGHFRESIALLEELTGADPSLAQAWIFLGLARYDSGSLQEAERAARRAIELEPKNGRALMLMASIYFDTGKPAQARAELKRYLDLYPDGPFAREARQRLAR